MGTFCAKSRSKRPKSLQRCATPAPPSTPHSDVQAKFLRIEAGGVELDARFIRQIRCGVAEVEAGGRRYEINLQQEERR